MAQQEINLGTAPGGTDGDDARTAFVKVNSNFSELYQSSAGSQPSSAKLTAIAASVWVANQLMYTTGEDAVAMTAFTALARQLLAADTDAAARIVIGAQQSNANLDALAGLAMVADQLPYSTGPGALALTSLTAAARALLDDVDAPAMRTTLGLGGQALQALNSLTGVANGVPFFNSSTTMQTSVSTAFGRGLWNLADAAAGRTVFGLGTAATVNTGVTGAALMAAADAATGRTALALGDAATATLTTNPYDPTVGRVSRVGDAGWGAAGIPSIAAIDLNAVRTNGLYYVAINTGQGSLPVNQNGYVLCKTVTSDYAIQDYEPVAQGDRYTRVLNNGVWTSWSKNFKQSNIVGTVSQSAGVPTGAVIERGTNVNGEFVKFADGTIDMWQLSPSMAHAVNTDLVHTWTLPFPVVSVGTGVLGLQLRTVNATNSYTQSKGVGALTDVNTATFRTQFSAAQNYAFFYTCKGRWF